MHGLGWSLEQVYKITTYIELSTDRKKSIPIVTTFNAVTTAHYSCVGECLIDRKVKNQNNKRLRAYYEKRDHMGALVNIVVCFI